MDLGAVWAGGSSSTPPVLLDACIIFASEGPLVVKALNTVRKGGVVVCAGIHMTDIPSFPYAALWNEKRIESVANLTVSDGKEFFELIAKVRNCQGCSLESNSYEGKFVFPARSE